MSGKALAAGIKEQDQLALHRCFLFLLRSSLRTPLMEQIAAAVDGGAPPDERTTAQSVAVLAADAHETQRRLVVAAAAAEASGGGRCRWRWRCRSARGAARCAAPRERGRRGTWPARRGDGGGEAPAALRRRCARP